MSKHELGAHCVGSPCTIRGRLLYGLDSQNIIFSSRFLPDATLEAPVATLRPKLGTHPAVRDVGPRNPPNSSFRCWRTRNRTRITKASTSTISSSITSKSIAPRRWGAERTAPTAESTPTCPLPAISKLSSPKRTTSRFVLFAFYLLSSMQSISRSSLLPVMKFLSRLLFYNPTFPPPSW